MSKVTVFPFGRTREGEAVALYRLENASGAYIELISYGAALRTVAVPDREGRLTDVCLGYDTIGEYERWDGCLGVVVGRCANRIKGARFTLNGKEYCLAPNVAPNHLHGGERGFHRYVWDHRVEGESVVFSRRSPDGEEHYPGNLTAEVRYTLTDRNEVVIDYLAQSDADTVVNLTNHAYWNLDGHGAGNVGGHTLQISAGAYTEMDEESCPSGVIADVGGTPFDLREARPLSHGWDTDHPQIGIGGGYDHNWALDGEGFRRVAVLASAGSGIALSVWTDQPGMQVYTANTLTDRNGKGGALYTRRCSVALETQAFPDAIHHANFPTAVLKAGETYRRKTMFAFS